MKKFKEDKIIFSDLDSTLLDGDGFFTSNTKKTVHELYDQGYLLVPLTARSTNDVLRQAKRLGIDKLGGIIGGNNGGQIFDFNKNQWIKNEFLTDEIVNKVFDETYNKFIAKVHYFGDDTTYVYARGENSLFWAQMMGADYVTIKSKEELTNPITHLTIVLKKQITESEKNEFLTTIIDKIKGKVDIHQYSDRVYDICPLNVSKGQAVKDIIEYLGWDNNKLHSYAFGDGANDITMFNEVTTGVAMENAIFELKEIADDHTTSYADDGVAKYLRKNILEK